ncbi:rod-binding protein [Candidatus Hydrogenedentota bacterium]
MNTIGLSNTADMLVSNSAWNRFSIEGKNIETTEDAHRAGREMESFFIYMMLKEMRKTINRTGLIDGGTSQRIMEEMGDEHIASEVAKTGSLGIAKIIAEELIRTQLKSGGGKADLDNREAEADARQTRPIDRTLSPHPSDKGDTA